MMLHAGTNATRTADRHPTENPRQIVASIAAIASKMLFGMMSTPHKISTRQKMPATQNATKTSRTPRAAMTSMDFTIGYVSSGRFCESEVAVILAGYTHKIYGRTAVPQKTVALVPRSGMRPRSARYTSIRISKCDNGSATIKMNPKSELPNRVLISRKINAAITRLCMLNDVSTKVRIRPKSLSIVSRVMMCASRGNQRAR